MLTIIITQDNKELKRFENQESDIKALGWYKYDTAKITILWKGITQPIGRFKTAEEALNTINSLCLNNTEITQFSIDTPNGVINYENFKN